MAAQLSKPHNWSSLRAPSMSSSNQKLGLALGFAGVLLFGGTLPATRLAVGYLDPWFLTAARWSHCRRGRACVALVLRRKPPPRRLWGELALTAFCTIIAFPITMALAMASVPAAHGGVVLGIVPLATVAAATLVADERPSLGFWLASLAGAAIVVVLHAEPQRGRRTLGRRPLSHRHGDRRRLRLCAVGTAEHAACRAGR